MMAPTMVPTLWVLTCPYCGATIGVLPGVPKEGWLKCPNRHCRARLPVGVVRVATSVE